MNHGIYLIANDKVTEHAIACLNSIRLHDPNTPIILIPYDDNYHNVAALLKQDYGVELYPDLEFIDRLSRNLHDIFGTGFFARPNQFRKQACWFGPFERFLYIDTDVVVFSPIAQTLAALDNVDFLCYDYQHNGGISNVFTRKVLDDGIFSQSEVQDIFNGGFWASKRGLLQESDLYEVFRECAAHPEYFDFSQKTSDQPIINYMILKRVSRRLNLVRQDGGGPGNWAGTSHFQYEGMHLVDPTVDKPLDYLHWAGIRIQPGCPYWPIWAHYRYLKNPEQRPVEQAPGSQSLTKTMVHQLKRPLKRFLHR